MRTRTLIGLMFCTLFSLSAPAFAQPSNAQPVLQTAQMQKDFIIPEGKTIEYDAAKGSLTAGGRLINNGVLRIKSSNGSVTDFTIEASEIENHGLIISDLPGKLILKDARGQDLRINSPGGEILAQGSIEFVSKGNIFIDGGKIKSKEVNFDSNGQLSVNAELIDGAVSLKAVRSTMKVAHGNLNVASQNVSTDPIYYNTGGAVSISGSISVVGDLVAIASRNVTTSSVTATGNILLVSGATFHFVNVVPAPNMSGGQKTIGGFPGDPQCQGDCSQSVVIDSQTGAGNVTVNGNLESSLGYIAIKTAINSANTIQVTGNVTASGSAAQFVFMEAGGNVKVTGTVNVDATATSSAGAIVINANSSKSATTNSTVFTVGGTGQANGVGAISAANIGSGSQLGVPFVLLHNSGKGGITVTTPTAVNIAVAQSQNGSLYLDARNGTITLPTGKLSLDGQNGFAAGSMIINATKIVLPAGAELSADDSGTGADHFITLIAGTVDYSGTSSIHANGLGNTASASFGNVQFIPAGAVVGGTGGACGNQFIQGGAVSINCSYNGGQVGNITVTGNGTLNVFSDGGTTNGLASTVSFNFIDSQLSFAGGGTVNIHTNGKNNANGGLVNLQGGSISVGNTTTTAVESSGNGTGQGGTIHALLNAQSTAITLASGKGGIRAFANGGKAAP